MRETKLMIYQVLNYNLLSEKEKKIVIYVIFDYKKDELFFIEFVYKSPDYLPKKKKVQT